MLGLFYFAALALLATSGIAQNPRVRVMPLGDSITEGDNLHVTYRYDLWRDLHTIGYCTDFVGSKTGVRTGKPLHANFDQDHEGHSAWRSDLIALRVRTWVRQAQPDIVLMHVGTVDRVERRTIAATAANLAKIVDEIRAAKSNAHIVIAKIIPLHPNLGLDVTTLHSEIVKIATIKDVPTSRVVVADPAARFDPIVDTYDGIHPTASGYRKMADAWFPVLRTLLRPCVAEFSAFGTGCGTSAGIPRLGADGVSRPVLGRTFRMRVTNLPARSNVALGVLGTSRTTWIGRRLPLDLGPFGMAGCQLLVAADYLENLPIGLTGASWTIALPTELRHLGVELFVQAAIMHQATSGPKVIWSNGGVVRIGR